MRSNKLSEYLMYRKTIKRLLLVGGMWPTEQPSLWYRFLSYAQLILTLSPVLVMVDYVRIHCNDVARVTKGISVMSGFLSGILKITCVITHRKDANKLHQMLDPNFFKLSTKPQLSSIILNELTTFRRLSLILNFTMYISWMVFVTAPLIFVIDQKLNHVHPIKHILVIPGVYPWNIPPNGFLYKFHYIFESVSTSVVMVISCGMDLLFTLYIFQMIGQFREMAYRITHIDENNDYRNAIRNCVTQHGILMECRDILEKIYGPIILWTMITNAINLCSQIFQVTQMINISTGRTIILIAYIMFKLMQTFLYAWAGSCLTKESENYKDAIYNANWYSNKCFMTSVLIMLAQRPLILTACKFSVVSVDIFIKVLNTTASYFFLLKTLDNKD